MANMKDQVNILKILTRFSTPRSIACVLVLLTSSRCSSGSCCALIGSSCWIGATSSSRMIAVVFLGHRLLYNEAAFATYLLLYH